MRFASVLLVLLAFIGCKEPTPIDIVLASDLPKIKKVMSDPDKYEIQILFTEVNRQGDQNITFNDYEYNVDDDVYFYPASSVKLPAAIFALEKITEFKRFGRYNPFQMENDSIETNLSDEIRKSIFLSDNESYNRVFEFVGKDELNDRMKARGIKGRFAHRLSTPDADNLTSKSFVFKTNDSTYTLVQRENEPIESLDLERIKKGKGYMEDDQLVNEPKDFSKKNYMPARSLHNIVKRLIFPNTFPKDQRFKLKPSERIGLINTMGLVPRQYGKDPEVYPDNYVKFLILGDNLPTDKKPKDIHIFNKVGYAYGYLIDTAYIVNDRTQKEYIITAVIHVNENQIFNDDQYEYDEIGIPFLAELGRQLVNHSGKNKE